MDERSLDEAMRKEISYSSENTFLRNILLNGDIQPKNFRLEMYFTQTEYFIFIIMYVRCAWPISR